MNIILNIDMIVMIVNIININLWSDMKENHYIKKFCGQPSQSWVHVQPETKDTKVVPHRLPPWCLKLVVD